MAKRIEIVFGFGESERRLTASRDNDGGLSVSLKDECEYGGNRKSIVLRPEETEALCQAMNGLGWSVPRMEQASRIGLHANGD